MNDFIRAEELRKEASLVEMLRRLGYEPVRKTGKELLYLSMLRDSDTKPSFAVNDELGLWFDHGTGQGGDIFEFGKKYWPGQRFPDVLRRIQETCALPVPSCGEGKMPSNLPPSPAALPHYFIEEIRELGHHPAITAYLKQRKVWEAAQGYLKEVYYCIENENRQRQSYFAAGWANERQGWELRNPYFKGCLGHKALSFIPRDRNKLVVFEGYFNFLSWRAHNPDAPESALILNSVALCQSGIEKALSFSKVSLFLDHDASGQRVLLEFQKALPWASDSSAVYKGFNDYNEYLTADFARRVNPDGRGEEWSGGHGSLKR